MAPPPAVQPGERYGRLTVVEFVKSASGKRQYRCACDCGSEAVVRGACLRSGQTRSCGCLMREVNSERLSTERPARRHGHYCDGRQSSTYISWRCMWERCTNPNSRIWKYYGGRGITVCERWRSFENFLEDMGERPKGRTLDRINGDGNYEKSNCRWATAKEQQANRRKA